MYQNPQYNDDPFTTPFSTPPLNTTYKWASRVPHLRFSRLRTTSFKISVLLFIFGTVLLMKRWSSSVHIENTILEHIPLASKPQFSNLNPSRLLSDTTDTFTSYKYRSDPRCNISSLDLHVPFEPLCISRPQLLDAMGGGGRIGMDAPYQPRDCDMRWFSTSEVCEVLGRFDSVVLVGDSMIRHLIGGLNILVRGDLGYGAVTGWNFGEEERRTCFCNEQFDAKACSVQGIYKTSDVVANDPSSLSCTNSINVMMELIVRHPIPPTELHRLTHALKGPHTKGIAIILGHGLWSNLDLTSSLRWLDAVLSTIVTTLPKRQKWHGLFVGPNAAGKEKPDEWVVSQGNKALMLYEEAMREEVERRNGVLWEEEGIQDGKGGLEFLGTWNMSVQKWSRDGVHMDMKGNLVKAMMVVNWLNMLGK